MYGQMSVRSTKAPLTLIVAAVFLCLGCRDKVVVEDYSGFESFAFQQESGLGYCPDLDTVLTATIERTAGGGLAFAAASIEAGVAFDEACPSGIRIEAGCAEVEPGPPRPLSHDEQAAVGEAFAAVRVHPQADRRCKRMGIDPCRILTFTWDAETHSDYVCSGNRLPAEQARAIADLLATLAAAS